MFDLSGRVALVTGAGKNVGAEIATQFAAQGAAVGVNDLFAERAASVADQITRSGGTALGVEGDVSDRDDVEEMVRRIEAELGPIDILVNNAGVPPNLEWDLVPFHRTAPESWSTWIDINLYGVLNCCHATVPGMVDRGWGRVVTIVSEGGRVGEPLMAVYCAAKAGAIGFTKALAKEVAPHGVTANCISLGTLGPPDGDPELAARMARRYPIGRVGRPSDVAPAAVYFASAEAEWVTGQTLPVSGGYATS